MSILGCSVLNFCKCEFPKVKKRYKVISILNYNCITQLYTQIHTFIYIYQKYEDRIN